MNRRSDTTRRRLGAFDLFVLAGGLVNVAVVTVLLVYWLAN